MGALTAGTVEPVAEAGAAVATKVRLATVWLGGCSGCHMSFLDTDEWLIELAQLVDVVYSPIADVKEFPENVDIALVEGAVANEEHLELIHQVRERSKVVVSFGDCAVTGNVTAMRNPLGKASSILQYVYVEAPKLQGPVPSEPGIVPVLLDRVEPVHEVIDVDFYIPGCPPPAPRIRAALEQALTTRAVRLQGRDLNFG
jgi:NAD-reducing hydrogenase small subunit